MKFESQRGFSLIELMVAIGILSIGMAAVGTMLFQSFEADRYNTKEKRAHALASLMAERFRAGNPKLDQGSPYNGTVYLKLPNQGNGGLVATNGGTGVYWVDATAPTNQCLLSSSNTLYDLDAKATFFCSWTTFTPSGSAATADPPEAGSATQILIGWGSGANCSRTSVDQCPRTQRIVVVRDGNTNLSK